MFHAEKVLLRFPTSSGVRTSGQEEESGDLLGGISEDAPEEVVVAFSNGVSWGLSFGTSA